MRLLNLLLSRRDETTAREISPEGRKARRRARPMVDGLEKREVFAVGFIGPVALAATPPAATAMTQDQTGTAFGMNWRSTYDYQTGNYRLDVEGVAGNSTVSINRGKAGIQFVSSAVNSSGQLVTTKVDGPALDQNLAVQIRQFRTAGDIEMHLGTGLNRTLTTASRKTEAILDAPGGQIRLTYDYDCVSNTGALTIRNVKGSGTFVLSNTYKSPRVGEKIDTPEANPVDGIDITWQGGSDTYYAGISTFVEGRANVHVNVTVLPPAQGNGYTFTGSVV